VISARKFEQEYDDDDDDENDDESVTSPLRRVIFDIPVVTVFTILVVILFGLDAHRYLLFNCQYSTVQY
jgi:hypothetical protein